MPGTTDRDTLTLALDPGEQALVSVPSMHAVLSSLPDDALDNLLVVSATTSPAKIESAVERRDGDPSKVGVVPITGSPTEYDGALWTTKPVDPSDLTGVSIRLSNALRHVLSGGWVVFDTLNVLLMYADEDKVFRLMDSVVSNVRAEEARGVYYMVQDAVTDETYARFRGLADTVVSLER